METLLWRPVAPFFHLATVELGIELGRKAFEDAAKGQDRVRAPFFKTVGGPNRTLGHGYSVGLLEFVCGPDSFSYFEKSGTIEVGTFKGKIGKFFEDDQGLYGDTDAKLAVGGEESIRKSFIKGVHCYFPPSRYELPHWLNQASTDAIGFRFRPDLARHLDKPIAVDSCSRQNQSWLLDVFLDVAAPTKQQGLHLGALTSANTILRTVLGDPDVHFAFNYRHHSAFRLCIDKGSRTTIPSVGHMSTGQAVLLNTFLTLVRYADRYNPVGSLESIEGFVLIDEVDAHLHANLQHGALPGLIRLFPRVQFVITSHSPLFVLGMERIFGSEGFAIIEMPKGQRITAERFKQFGESFAYYRDTKAFTDELTKALSEDTRPWVLTEGETDPDYLRTALELLGANDLSGKLRIEWVGMKSSQGPRNSGSTALDHFFNSLATNPDFSKRKVLFLYDCDTQKKDLDQGPLSVRAIPANSGNTKCTAGIENLLPPQVFEPQFYSEVSKSDGGSVKTLNKTQLRDHVCGLRRVGDFAGFEAVIKILRNFVQEEHGAAAPWPHLA